MEQLLVSTVGGSNLTAEVKASGTLLSTPRDSTALQSAVIQGRETLVIQVIQGTPLVTQRIALPLELTIRARSWSRDVTRCVHFHRFSFHPAVHRANVDAVDWIGEWAIDVTTTGPRTSHSTVWPMRMRGVR